MKKGQITIFIIIGLVILLTIVLLTYIAGRERISPTELPAKLLTLDSSSASLIVTECLQKLARQGTYIIASHGGYITPKGAKIYGEEGDDFPIHYHFPQGASPYLLNGKEYSIRTIDKMSSMLERYIAVNLPNCLDFSAFEDAGFEVLQPTSNFANNLLTGQVIYIDEDIPDPCNSPELKDSEPCKSPEIKDSTPSVPIDEQEPSPEPTNPTQPSPQQPILTQPPTSNQPLPDYTGIGFDFSQIQLTYTSKPIFFNVVARDANEDITIHASYPILLRRGTEQFEISEFYTSIDLRLALLQKLARIFVTSSAEADKTNSKYIISEHCSDYSLPNEKTINVYNHWSPYEENNGIQIVDSSPVLKGNPPLKFQFGARNAKILGACVG